MIDEMIIFLIPVHQGTHSTRPTNAWYWLKVFLCLHTAWKCPEIAWIVLLIEGSQQNMTTAATIKHAPLLLLAFVKSWEKLQLESTLKTTITFTFTVIFSFILRQSYYTVSWNFIRKVFGCNIYDCCHCKLL